MTTETFNIGDTHRTGIVFKDMDGNAADPDTVTFTVIEPDGTVTTYEYATDAELVKDATGTYHVDYVYSQKGRHTLKWTGTGSIQIVEPFETYVMETR